MILLPNVLFLLLEHLNSILYYKRVKTGQKHRNFFVYTSKLQLNKILKHHQKPIKRNKTNKDGSQNVMNPSLTSRLKSKLGQ